MKKLSLVRCGSELMHNVACINPNKQEDLNMHHDTIEFADNIPIKYISCIEEMKFQEYLVYESYKPSNLREMKGYVNFILKSRKILPNLFGKYAGREGKILKRKECIDDIFTSNEVSQEIKNYYNSEVETKLPKQLSKLLYNSNR